MRTLWFRSLMVTLSLLILLPSVTIIVDNVLKNRTYTLSKDVSALIGKSTVDTKLIKTTDTAFTYNRAEESNAPEDIQKVLEIAAKKEDATGKKPYQAELAKDADDGITFSDSEGDRSFKLVPQYNTANPRLDDEGRVIYPNGSNEKHIYSFKTNGIKSDIVLTEAPKDTTKDYTWELELGSQLEARMLPDGGVGIYSADPTLFGQNLQIGDQKSQELIDKARKNGAKNTLAFELPKPFIIDANNQKNYDDVNYTLKQNILTLQTRNLNNQAYPLTIDPTIVVTTTSDFTQKTGDIGNTDFTTDGQIERGEIGSGATGAWAATSSFMTTRRNHTTVAYNGYMYIIGGDHATTDTACHTVADTGCSDVQFAPINSDGTTGTWHYTHNSTDDGVTFVSGLPTIRFNHSSVVYNGYIYVMGGCSAGSCTAYESSVLYAPINSNGTVGTWTATSSFATARTQHAAAVYNGYLYIMGGYHPTSDTACNGVASIYCSDVQYAPIKADGTLGTWNPTTNFTTARTDLTAAAYNGYMYIMGGWSGAYESSVQFAPINANGTVGTFTATTAMSRAECYITAHAYNGYLYVVAGLDGGYLSEAIYAPINANGTVGTWLKASNFTSGRFDHSSVIYNDKMYVLGGNTGSFTNDVQYATIGQGSTSQYTISSTYFTNGREGHTSVAYNGYLYVIGGWNGSLNYNDVQYAPINANGTIGSWAATASFTNSRQSHTSVAYNGYLYVIGGGGASAYGDVQYAYICDGTATGGCTAGASNIGKIGTWAATTSLSFDRNAHTSVTYNGYLYVIGGYTTATYTRLNDVQYAPINANGTIGTWAATTSFATARTGHTSVTYNGYLYVIGGTDGGSYLNDVQYAPINANGTIGSWAATASFATGRSGHTSVAYNGYLYVIGGGSILNDVQYAYICDGTATGGCTAGAGNIGKVGTWAATTSFATGRERHTSVTYNGYLYVIGGYRAGAGTACNPLSSNYCTDTQSAKIGQSNSAGTWTTDVSSYYNFPRTKHTSIAYNGYLYIVGGWQGTLDANCKNSGTSNSCNDVQYAAINADGSLGAFTSGTTPRYFSVPRSEHTSVVYNGYLYVIGGNQGTSTTACKNSGTSMLCNDVQYAQLNADGSLGAFTSGTTPRYFNFPRDRHASVAYNGYLYVIGGDTGISDANCKNSGTNTRCNDVQYAQLNTDGSLGAFTTDSSSYFSVPRMAHASVAYNGYLYVTGGWEPNSDTACKDRSTSYHCNDVQYASINSDGSLGSFVTDTSSYFKIPRSNFGLVAYNGSFYVIGGYNPLADTTCKNTGIASTYCNDIQYAQINPDGSLGDFTLSNTIYFSTPRDNNATVAYNGYIFSSGGQQLNQDANCKSGGSSYQCTDVQYTPALTQNYNSRYERNFDTNSAGNIINTFTIDGTAQCEYTVTYKTAGNDGVLGSATTFYNVSPGTAQTLNIASKRYVYMAATMDDSTCGGQSNITSISLNYNAAPDAPTLVLPANGVTAVNVLPEFRLGSTDDSNDYIQYKIELCTTSNCSSVLRTINQSVSQIGWTSQGQQSGTAYSGGSPLTQLGIHQYQPTALSANTQYWWRAQALDPGGTNQWSVYSDIYSFTTGDTLPPAQMNIGGGTTIYGGTNFSTGN